MAIAVLRENGHKVSNAAGAIGLARKLGLSVRPGDKSGAKSALRAFFCGKDAKTLLRPKSKRAANFYLSDEWREVRYKALVRSDGKCQCCGNGKHNGKLLHVDHIKPRSLFPDLELSLGNLQVLCEDCNKGKSNKDQTDWRFSRIQSEYSDAAVARQMRLVSG